MKNLRNYLALILISLISFSCVEQEKFNESDREMMFTYLELYQANVNDIPLESFMKSFEAEVKAGNYSYTNEDAYEYYIERFIELNKHPIYFPENEIRPYFLNLIGQ